MNHLLYSSFMAWRKDKVSLVASLPSDVPNIMTHSKVVHVTEEDVDFDNLVDVRASSNEDGLEVADASSGLLLDGAPDQVALGVKMDLARAVDCRRGLDGLGLE